MVAGGADVDRGRRALQRPGDGRPDDPGRGRAGGARGCRARRRPSRRACGRRRRGRGRGHVLLEPDRPLRRGALRRRPRRRPAARGAITPDLIPDEARPGSRPAMRTAWTASSSSRRPRPMRGSYPRRPRRAASSTRRRRWVSPALGTRSAAPAQALVARVRRLAPDLPVCVGLGVSNGAQAAEVAAFADGVIVGSAFVRRLLDDPGARWRRSGARARRGPRRRRPPPLSRAAHGTIEQACPWCGGPPGRGRPSRPLRADNGRRSRSAGGRRPIARAGSASAPDSSSRVAM